MTKARISKVTRKLLDFPSTLIVTQALRDDPNAATRLTAWRSTPIPIPGVPQVQATYKLVEVLEVRAVTSVTKKVLKRKA